MKKILLLLLLLPSFTVFAQSGKSVGAQQNELKPVRELWLEANAYVKTKFAQFEKQQVKFNEALRDRTVAEQKALALRLATEAVARKTIEGDDRYYIGLLYWIAGNLPATEENVKKYLETGVTNGENPQTARSLVALISARDNRFSETQKMLDEYQKALPINQKEIFVPAVIASESALKIAENETAFAFAEIAWKAAEKYVSTSDNRADALDKLVQAADARFNSSAALGKIPEADSALLELAKTSKAFYSSTTYTYALDKLIVHQIETGRKSTAMATFENAVANASKDFPAIEVARTVLQRLKKNEPHYRILGDTVPELVSISDWFPGEKRSLSAMRGKVVLLDFWATWCGPCIQQFPHLNQMEKDLGPKGLEIIGVVRAESDKEPGTPEYSAEVTRLKNFRSRNNLLYDFAVSSDSLNQITFGAASIPSAIIVDKKGVVRYARIGTNEDRPNEIRKTIEKLLAEN